MKIIEPSYVIMTKLNRDEILKHIEHCGRVCYKSEKNIKPESAETFVRGLIKRGHEAMIEHFSVTVKFICDRGVSHEIVRHRIASFAQESTRYCNYSKDDFNNEITVIRPFYLDEGTSAWWSWADSCAAAEKAYFNLLDFGLSPQEARAVLPSSLKTEIVVTMDLREWRHFFKLRALGTTGKPHPQMKQLAKPLLEDFKSMLPEIFGDLEVQK